MVTKTGGCQCGSIKYRLTGVPKMLYICHCTDCQKQSSSAFGMSLIMDANEIAFVKGKNRLKTLDTRCENGLLKRCVFCPDCGTRILHGSDNPEQPVSIKAGSLDDTSWLDPVAHIWLKSAQPWVAIDRDHYLCFDREPEDETALKKLWQTRIQTS